MTGASSGFGTFTLRHLLKRGYSVYIIARNPEKLPAEVKKHQNLKILIADLLDLNSLSQVIKGLSSKVSFDLVINNAGIMSFERSETIDGFESTYQVNLLAPFLITELVRSRLNKGAKMINTVSALHQGEINFKDLQFKSAWSMLKSYRQSKLGLILLTRIWAKEFGDLNFYSQHPGVIRTNLAKNADWISKTVFWIIGKSTEKGSETLNHLIDCSANELTSGEYYANKQVKKITAESEDLAVAKKLRDILSGQIKPFL